MLSGDFDNEALIRQMVEAQGYVLAPDGQLTVPENTILKTSVPSELVPHCPHCGKLLTMNLRSDDSFVEDAAGTPPPSGTANFSAATRGRRFCS